jgi:hypothetical protein
MSDDMSENIRRYDEAREYYGPPKQSEAQRWEYQLVFIYQDKSTKYWTTGSGVPKRMLVEVLDANGADGWELVNFSPLAPKHEPGYINYEYMAAFKRPL